MNPAAKSAMGYDGGRIHVGDRVVSNKGVEGVVLKMWRQGYDGTIIETDTAPDPDYPHHRQGQASKTYRRLRATSTRMKS